MSSLPLQGAGKLLYLRSADDTVPALGLNVYGIQSKSILINDAVDASVATSTYSATRILTGTTVTHGHEKIDYQTLEKRRRCGFYLL